MQPNQCFLKSREEKEREERKKKRKEEKKKKKKMHLAAEEPRTLSVARIPEGLDFKK